MYLYKIQSIFYIIVLPLANIKDIQGLPSGYSGQREYEAFDPELYEYQRNPSGENRASHQPPIGPSNPFGVNRTRQLTIDELQELNRRRMQIPPTNDPASFISYPTGEVTSFISYPTGEVSRFQRVNWAQQFQNPSREIGLPTFRRVIGPETGRESTIPQASSVTSPALQQTTHQLNELTRQKILNDITERITGYFRSDERPPGQSSEASDYPNTSLVDRFHNLYNPTSSASPSSIDVFRRDQSKEVTRVPRKVPGVIGPPRKFDETLVAGSVEMNRKTEPTEPLENLFSQTSASSHHRTDVLRHSKSDRKRDQIFEEVTENPKFSQTPSTGVVEERRRIGTIGDFRKTSVSGPTSTTSTSSYSDILCRKATEEIPSDEPPSSPTFRTHQESKTIKRVWAAEVTKPDRERTDSQQTNPDELSTFVAPEKTAPKVDVTRTSRADGVEDAREGAGKIEDFRKTSTHTSTSTSTPSYSDILGRHAEIIPSHKQLDSPRHKIHREAETKRHGKKVVDTEVAVQPDREKTDSQPTMRTFVAPEKTVSNVGVTQTSSAYDAVDTREGAGKIEDSQKTSTHTSTSSSTPSYSDICRNVEKKPPQEQPLVSPGHRIHHQEAKTKLPEKKVVGTKVAKPDCEKSTDSQILTSRELCTFVAAEKTTSQVDVVAEVRRLNPQINITYSEAFPELGAVLIVGKTKKDISELEKTVAKSAKLAIKPIPMFRRAVRIHNVPARTTKYELAGIILSKYGEKPKRIRLLFYDDGRKLKFAKLEVSPNLFKKIQKSPFIKIGGDWFTMNTSLRVFRCAKCKLLGHLAGRCWNEPNSYPSPDKPCLDCSHFNTITRQMNLDREWRDENHMTDDDECPTKQYFLRKWEPQQEVFFINAENTDSDYTSSESDETMDGEDLREVATGSETLEESSPQDTATTLPTLIRSDSSVVSRNDERGHHISQSIDNEAQPFELQPATVHQTIDEHRSPSGESLRTHQGPPQSSFARPSFMEILRGGNQKETGNTSQQIFNRITDDQESSSRSGTTPKSESKKPSFSEILNRKTEKELEKAPPPTSRYHVLGRIVNKGRGIGSPKLNRVDSGGSTSSPRVSDIDQELNYLEEPPVDHGVLIRPITKNTNIDTLAEIHRLNTYGIKFMHTRSFPSAVLVVCESETDADRLRTIIAQSKNLQVKPFKTFPRKVRIPWIGKDVTESDITDEIASKFEERPDNVHFESRDSERGLQVAVFEVSKTLLKKMEASPTVRIRGRRLKIDTSVIVERCDNCQLLGHVAGSNCFNKRRSFPSQAEPCIDCTSYNDFLQNNTNQQLIRVDHPTDDDRCPRKIYFKRKWERHQCASSP